MIIAGDDGRSDIRGLSRTVSPGAMDAVHRYEGYVAQSRGDGIFSLFGAPIAQEDHARRALCAALRMQEDIKRYSDRLRIEKGAPLAIRVGLNSGEMVVRAIRKDDLHTGPARLSGSRPVPHLFARA